MFFGIFGAVIQKKIKKLLVFSTITFIGYYLTGFIAMDLLLVEDVLHYILIYIINLIGVFVFILNYFLNNKYFINKLITLNKLAKENILLSFLITNLVFSISGIPPF
jgi:NADH:ubiquinone oxidoreductase subunit 2 (subunit N)